MKYAVIYSSKTGNTKKLAEAVYISLPEGNREIVNSLEMDMIPDADMYFIGFPVHNRSCGLEIFNLLEKIEDSEIAFFCSCGLSPNDNYISIIENRIKPWIDESCNYRGLFVCQGKAENKFQEEMKGLLPEYTGLFNEIFGIGDSHPNDDDFERISEFTERLLSEVEMI